MGDDRAETLTGIETINDASWYQFRVWRDDRAETLTGIETTNVLPAPTGALCDDRAETLTGIETLFQ